MARTTAPKANGSSGRDTRGRFAPGNKGGPGNPHAAKVARLRKALVGAVSEKDVRALAKDMVREARAGNVQAAKLLLSYLLGPPKVDVEVSGPGGGPIQSVTGEEAIARLTAELQKAEDAGTGS